MKLIRSSEDQKIEVGSNLIVKHGSTELYRIEIDTNTDQLRYASVRVFTTEGFLDTVAIFNTNDVISIERVTDDKSLS